MSCHFLDKTQSGGGERQGFGGVVAQLLLVSLLAAGCGRQKATPGIVAFAGSGVQLAPGVSWKITRKFESENLERNICLPVLEGQGRLKGAAIHVFSSPEGSPTDLNVMADLLIGGCKNQSDVVQNSLAREDFVTDGGLQGIHFSFQSLIEGGPRKGRTVTHCYLVKNVDGRCVRLRYTTLQSRDAEDVHEMIKATLASQ